MDIQVVKVSRNNVFIIVESTTWHLSGVKEASQFVPLKTVNVRYFNKRFTSKQELQYKWLELINKKHERTCITGV